MRFMARLQARARTRTHAAQARTQERARFLARSLQLWHYGSGSLLPHDLLSGTLLSQVSGFITPLLIQDTLLSRSPSPVVTSPSMRDLASSSVSRGPSSVRLPDTRCPPPHWGPLLPPARPRTLGVLARILVLLSLQHPLPGGCHPDKDPS